MSNTEISIFRREGVDIRVVTIEGEPWFIAMDALAMLDVNRSSLALLDDDERGVHTVDTLGGQQSLTVISESGLYSLILRSRKAEAKAFKKWITREVIPSIRKTGAYVNETPEQLFARALVQANTMLTAKDATILELAPKAEAYDRLAGSPTLIKIEVAARKAGVGRTTAFKLLRDNGIFSVYSNTPKALHAHHFEEVPATYQNSAGEDITTFTTKVHADSLVWLVSTIERFAAVAGKEIA